MSSRAAPGVAFGRCHYGVSQATPKGFDREKLPIRTHGNSFTLQAEIKIVSVLFSHLPLKAISLDALESLSIDRLLREAMAIIFVH